MKIKNLPLLVGIALPIVFIIIISIVVFTPSWSIKPRHNFLYSGENSAYSYYDTYRNTYEITGNRLFPKQIAQPANTAYAYKGDFPPLFLYDVRTDTTHQISLTEAENLALDPGPSSPDGYTVSYQYGGYGLFDLFGSGNDGNGYFIQKGNAKKRLAGLSTGGNYYNNNNFKFVGWVK